MQGERNTRRNIVKNITVGKKEKKKKKRSSHCGSGETNLTNIHEDVGSIPGLAQWVSDPVLP